MPSAYPPSVGGVEELTRHLALALVAAGDQVEVWTGLPDDHAPESVEVRDGLVVRAAVPTARHGRRDEGERDEEHGARELALPRALAAAAHRLCFRSSMSTMMTPSRSTVMCRFWST